MLCDDAAVLVAAVDDPGQVAEDIADITFRNDYQLVQRRQEPPVNDYFATQAGRLSELPGSLSSS